MDDDLGIADRASFVGLAVSAIQSRAAIRMLQPAGRFDINVWRWADERSSCCFREAGTPKKGSDPLTQFRWGESRMILGLFKFGAELSLG